MAAGTYVYCLVGAARKPSLARVPSGLQGTGPVRLLDVSTARSRRWLVVADAPLARYGEQAIKKGLANLDWVSRAAVAHEAVIEAFIRSTAVLPMKLFTIFANDDRARAHIAADAARIDRLLNRVSKHHEWGLRVTLECARPAPSQVGTSNRSAGRGGAGYLAHKKAQRDASTQLARHARETVADLFDELAALATDAHRRGASELPVTGGPLLLDAIFLVRQSGERRFQRLVDTHARALAPSGYAVSLSGPWPPYGFMNE